MPRAWIVIVALTAACKDRPRDTPIAPGSGSGSATLALAAADAAAVVADAAASSRCTSPCLYLLDTPLAEAPAAHARDCGVASWPYPEDDCDALLFARNCIYAGHGNVFKRPEWKARFEPLPWYKPRPDFKDSDFSQVAHANVKALVAASKACGMPVPPVTAEDRERVTKWFGDFQMDRADVDGKPVDGDVLGDLRNHHVDDKTTMVYTAAPENGVRTIEVGNLYHAVGPGETDESTTAHITIDADGRVIEVTY